MTENPTKLHFNVSFFSLKKIIVKAETPLPHFKLATPCDFGKFVILIFRLEKISTLSLFTPSCRGEGFFGFPEV